MADRKLVVHIIGDDKSFQQAMGRTTRTSKNFGNQMSVVALSTRSLFAAAGVTLGATALAQGFRTSVSAASDLNEEISKSRQVFGDSSRGIEEWSKTTADALGISQTAALRATGTFGNLFSVVGLAPEAASNMSRALVQLAADLASFNNADPSDVLIALRSGLIGEAEPLRRYGVLLSEARVQQQAMADTGKTNVKALTDQEKALARYKIILQDTESAQGDFERTSEGLANQTRILRANLNDLAANLGDTFLPAVNGAVGVVNDLFDGFDRLSDFGNTTLNIDVNADLSDLRRAREEIAALKGESDLMVRALDQAIGRIEAAREVPKGSRGDERIGVLTERQREAREVEEEARKTKAALERSQKAFSESFKGLGLKLDKAGLTASLDDDLAVLREIERRIQRQIAREGRTFDLVQQLTDVRSQISTTVAARASQQAEDSRDAWEDLIGALDLKLQRALGTARLDDDLAALRRIETALRQRIAAEGRTLELERQLLDVRQQIADTRRRQRQGAQFEALGLTEEGDRRGPSTRNLQQRAARLEDQIAGTVLDTTKTRNQLQRIARVLSGEFGKVGKDVREAILQMLNDIANALKDGSRKTGEAVTSSTGEITRGGIRSTEKLIAGLGLTPEQIEIIRQRNRGAGIRGGLSAFGFAVGQPSTGPTGMGFGGAAGEAQINLNIYLDGKELENVVTRRQVKKGRRTSASRRGRAGANKLGLG